MSERDAVEIMAEMVEKMADYIKLLESANAAIGNQLLKATDGEQTAPDMNEITFFQLNAGLFAMQKKDFRKDLKRLSDELNAAI